MIRDVVLRRWLIAVMLPIIGSCTTGRPAPSDTAGCFWPSQVSGFSDAGPDTAVVRVGTQRMWAMTLSRGCPDVDWALNIGIRSRGGQAVCPGRPAELIVPDVSGTSSRTCLATDIRPLSAGEVAAMTERAPSQR